MTGLAFPIYATLGNHELGTRDDLFHDYYGRGNFSFVYRNVQFTLLDTASATLAPVVYDWLGGWLIEGIDRVHFVFAHIPPLDPIGTRNGAFASRLEANKLAVAARVRQRRHDVLRPRALVLRLLERGDPGVHHRRRRRDPGAARRHRPPLPDRRRRSRGADLAGGDRPRRLAGVMSVSRSTVTAKSSKSLPHDLVSTVMVFRRWQPHGGRMVVLGKKQLLAERERPAGRLLLLPRAR